jgi:predicted nuclease with TOPRIM domain
MSDDQVDTLVDSIDVLRARIAELEALRDHDHCLMEKLEAEVERCRFIAASGARDFEIQRERIAELEAENADVRHKNHTLFDEVEKEREENAELRDQRGHNHYMLTQAVEFLRRYLNDKFYADVAEFLSEMEDTDGQD